MPSVKLKGNRDEQVDISALPLVYLQTTCSRHQVKERLHHQMSPEDSRQHRYTLAEQQLVTTFFHCSSEPSIRQLQIRTLEKATTLLKAHAQDTSHRALRLKKTLDDHSLEYDVYTSTKEEKWMADHWQQKLDLKTQNLEQTLQRLKNGEDISIATSRKDANLARFLAHSHTRTKHARRSVAYRTPKRMTKADVKPFRLSTALPPREPIRPLSDSVHVAPSKPSQVAPVPTPFPPKVTIDIASLPVLEEPTPSPTEQSSLVPTPEPPAPLQLPMEAEEEDAGPGFVTIYRLPPQRCRTRSQLMASVRVPLPEYAKDLLDRLGSITEVDSSHLELTRPTTPESNNASPASHRLRHRLSAPFSRADNSPDGKLLNKVKKRLSFR